jgi:hypothetical protein
MRRPPKSGRRGREPFAHQPMDSGTWAECCLTRCYGRSSNPSGFHDIRSGRRCGIRPGVDRATARRGPRYSVALLCDLLLHRRSRFGHCRSGSRLRRIVRLCWRHSRRGRNGQSRCAGRLQVSSQYRTGWPQSAPRGDWQWRLNPRKRSNASRRGRSAATRQWPRGMPIRPLANCKNSSRAKCANLKRRPPLRGRSGRARLS